MNNLALNGFYNPLTAQAISQSFNTNLLSRGAANASGIYDYTNNAYTNSIANNAGTYGALNNFDPYSMNYGLMGMNPSFGMGMGYGYGMGMYGFGPGTEIMGMSQSDYMRYQEQLQRQGINSQTNLRKAYNAADYEATAGEKAVKERSEVLHDQIVRNNQENVMSEYNALKESVAAQLKRSGYVNTSGAVDEEFLKAYTNDLYEKVTGRGIAKDLMAHGDTFFLQGLKQGLFGMGFFTTNKRNRAENAADITGTEITNSDKAWRVAGVAAGAILTGGLAALAIFSKKIFKPKV